MEFIQAIFIIPKLTKSLRLRKFEAFTKIRYHEQFRDCNVIMDQSIYYFSY
jgi:hypothetical protein